MLMRESWLTDWNIYPAVFTSGGDTAVPSTAVYEEEYDDEDDNGLIKTVRPLAAEPSC